MTARITRPIITYCGWDVVREQPPREGCPVGALGIHAWGYDRNLSTAGDGWRCCRCGMTFQPSVFTFTPREVRL